MNTFLYYFVIFFIYSVLGWAVESTFVSVKQKKFINRGFLIGPYCPIYGYGSLIMILYISDYKDNIITVFILAVVICSILEYFTSYMMEKLFKARWWDYSNKKFNLNGRICGENAMLFGLGGVLIIYIVHPFVSNLLANCNTTVLLWITIICFIIYLLDTIFSLNVIQKFKKTISGIDLRRDSSQDFSKMVMDTLISRKNGLQKRLLAAFPNTNLKELKEYLKKKEEMVRKSTKKK